MGLADWAAKNMIPYIKNGGVFENIFKHIQYACIQESIQLAKEEGPFIAFDQSAWATGEMISRYKMQDTELDWDYLQAGIDTYGIRNSQLTAIAPNTSTSLLHGCSASILPVFSKFYYDNNSSGVVPVVAKHIKENPWGYTEYRHMPHKEVNSVISSIQKWVDTGISYELMFDLNDEKVNAKYIYDVITDAWGKGIKALYYVRSVQKNSNIEKCEACAG